MSNKVFGDLQAGDEEPWLAKESSFSKSEDSVRIARAIRYLKENHAPLTLVDGGGIRQESLLVSINEGSLQIDRPLEWVDEPDFFRVFFRDHHQNWNYFLASAVSYSPFALSVAMPEELHNLQRRSCHRVKLPIGTRALVKNGNRKMSTVFVQDLSAAGMLMFNDPAEGEYSTDTIINDIVVSIPGDRGHSEGNFRKVLPLIGQGRIVRSYLDEETRRPCYGVSFQYESSSVKETINQIISEVENDFGQNDFLC